MSKAKWRKSAAKKGMMPLKGIRVLDLTRYLAGPFCTRRLGDLGAEVIKIEDIQSGDPSRYLAGPKIQDTSSYFIIINRNKKGITLNLRNDQGRKIFYDLVKISDVVVDNYRAGVTKKAKLDYDSLKKINPKITQIAEPIVVPKEGCLSIPDNWVQTKRFRKITVTTLTDEGIKSMEFSGFLAIVVQHEMDHMYGILNVDRRYIPPPVVGRNEKCPCGSGLKYKKCCLGKLIISKE